jgi:hypothetical protein
MAIIRHNPMASDAGKVNWHCFECGLIIQCTEAGHSKSMQSLEAVRSGLTPKSVR